MLCRGENQRSTRGNIAEANGKEKGRQGAEETGFIKGCFRDCSVEDQHKDAGKSKLFATSNPTIVI